MEDCFGQALSTKIKSMYSKNLKMDDYSELVSKSNIREVAEYLKNTKRYSGILDGVKDSNIHRGQLEILVKKRAFINTLKLTRYFPRDKSEYYSYPKIETEIGQILSKLRYIKSEEKNEYVHEFPEFLKEYVCFDLVKLNKAETFDQLLRMLEGTPYYKILESCYDETQKYEFRYLHCERLLENFLFKHIETNIKKCLKGNDKKIITQYFNMQKDLENITSAWRLRKYFKFSTQEIQELLIPYSKNGKDSSDFRMKKLRHEIFVAQTEEDIMKTLKTSQYSKIADENMMIFEKKFKQMIYKNCRRNMMFSNSPEIIYTSFLTLEHIEVENIITVIEGVRYNMSPNKIKGMILI